jgi:prepilin-type processing-associated H-X9-DG protein
MNAIKLSAQKAKDVSNLKKIAEAWKECYVNRGWKTASGQLESELAGYDRRNISDMVLNDPSVYISPGDKYASKVIGSTICKMGSNGEINNVFPYPWSGVSNFMTSISGYLLSYCLINKLPPNVPLETTPLAYTRGLRVDGKWDEKCGLYGSQGGYVVYCDGHVTWFDGSHPARFLKWDRTGYTSDIRYAIPSDCSIHCGDGGDRNYRSDPNDANALVILGMNGQGGY